MTIDEILKAANITDEVIAGLPKEVTAALTGFASETGKQLTASQQAQADAAEKLRLAKLTEQEVNQYVEKYGEGLVGNASVIAERDALKAALESVKAQGFNINIPTVAQPAVPGSPARGANVEGFDPVKFSGQVGAVIAQVVDANNEHLRLTGAPLPDSIEAIAEEARQSRKPVKQYVEEKYKFNEIRASKIKADRQKELDEATKAAREDERRKVAEENGGNPNLRPGVPSNSSFVKKINHEDFEKSNGNTPRRERIGRMLEKIHQDAAARQSA